MKVLLTGKSLGGLKGDGEPLQKAVHLKEREREGGWGENKKEKERKGTGERRDGDAGEAEGDIVLAEWNTPSVPQGPAWTGPQAGIIAQGTGSPRGKLGNGCEIKEQNEWEWARASRRGSGQVSHG